jgi:conjugative relaxase-like TrwC/TraI family protein
VLSIAAMSAGQDAYYSALAREDYYRAGREPEGRWFGRGAEALGLARAVDGAALRNLFRGFSADGEMALVRNAGDERRQPGWDLTFSAPKSVSTLWAMADPIRRQDIQEAHRRAVEAALKYIEDEFAFTRRGRGGTDRERVGLVIGCFDHGTSRAQDPDLHTHCLVLNVGVGADGRTRTVVSRKIYVAKMAAGALYRAHLSHDLETRLGTACERRESWFEVVGIPKALTEEFSKRRDAIKADLAARGESGAEHADEAARRTRERKEVRPREELFRDWQAVGRAYGCGPEEARDLFGGPRPASDPARRAAAAVRDALARITEHESHFVAQDVVRFAAEAAQCRQVPADAVRAAVADTLRDSPEVVRLGRDRGEERFTTREMMDLEKKLLTTVEAGRADDRHVLMPAAIRVGLRALAGLPAGPARAEQEAALLHVTTRPGSVQVVSGLAGTGKSTLLNAVREAEEASGHRVIGAAVQGTAARGIEDGAGIRSSTIHRLLAALDRADMGLGPKPLNDKTILVLDEAGTIGTRQMERLLDHAARAGTKVVCVGDERQLQSVEAGGPFAALGRRVGRAELTEIVRQRDARDRAAVRALAAGEAAAALRDYAERGRLTVTDDKRGAMAQLVRDWNLERTSWDPKDLLILAGTRADVAALNRLAQAERVVRGELNGPTAALGRDRVYAGDRILFTRNSDRYAVWNGNRGTVLAVEPLGRALAVRLDDGRKLTVPLADYPHLLLGYAVTTHKGQGATVESCLCLLSEQMQDREMTYVQSSRARGVTRLYTDRATAGDGLADLTRQVERSHQKELAHDLAGRASDQWPAHTLEVTP